MKQHDYEETAPNSKIAVLIVDDHVLIGETIAAALRTSPDFEVDVVVDAVSAYRKIDESGSYDLILLDYDIPGGNGLGAIKQMVERNGGGVALFSGVAKRSVIERAIDHGAIGFVPKTLPLKSLKHAIRFMSDGELFLPSSFSRGLDSAEADDFGIKLTEKKVLTLLADGRTNKEIARELGFDETTVKMHVRTLFRKLEVSNRTQVVLAGQKLGMC